MFGPAFLVNPVTTAGATSRSVYFPAGTWYDFWTGATTTGGSRVTVTAPLSQIPLYVKAGSIVPMGPNIQYATQSIDPLEIRIYKGQGRVLHPLRGRGRHIQLRNRSVLPDSIHVERIHTAADDRRKDG